MVQKKQWHNTKYPGVRYRESDSRPLHNGRPDRYYVIRYKRNRKPIGEACGWASEGMTPSKAAKFRADLVENIRTGKRPQSLAEARQMEADRREMDAIRKKQAEIDAQTFDDLAVKFLAWGRENKKSWADDEGRYLNHVKPVIGKMRALDVSPFNLEKIRSNAQNKGVSPKTVEHILAFVRSVYRKAKSWGIYKGDIPTDEIQFPRFDNQRTRFLSLEEAHTLLEAIYASSETVYAQAILSLYAGLRFGEIAALTWGAVDFENGLIHIFDPKGVDTRRAYIVPKLRQVLEDIKPPRPEPEALVFPARTGGQQQHVSTGFYRVVSRLFNKGVTDRRQKVTFHTLRHTFCSWLAMNGATPFEIMDLAGHKDLAMTKRYSHVAENSQRKAVERMTDEFESSRSEALKVQRIKERA